MTELRAGDPGVKLMDRLNLRFRHRERRQRLFRRLRRLVTIGYPDDNLFMFSNAQPGYDKHCGAGWETTKSLA